MIKDTKKQLTLLWIQLRKGIFQVLSANVLNKGIAMLSNMVITRLLSKPEYGLWSYILNLYSYLNLLSGCGLISGALQFGAENKDKKEEFQFYRYCLRVGMIINTALIALFFAGSLFVDFALDGAKTYLRIYMPILLLEYLLNLLLTILRSESRIPEYARILNVNTMINAVGTCSGAAFGITGVIVGRYVAILLSVTQILWKTRPEIKKMHSSENLTELQIRPLWHYSLFVGASSAMNSLLYLMDVSMIAEFVHNPLDIANYKVATLIPIAVGFIPDSVITAVLPDIIQHHLDREWLKNRVRKLFLGMTLVNFVLCTGLFLLAEQIIGIVSGTQYLPAVPIFRVLLIEYFFSGTFRVLSANILAGLRYVNYGFFVSITSAVCDIIFNILLIKEYGVMGAAYATLGSMIVAGALAFGYLYYKLFCHEG